MAARFSPLFFRTEPVRGEETLIITIHEKINDTHKRWLASNQAAGIWNFKAEQVVTQVLQQKYSYVPNGKGWLMVPPAKPVTEVHTTIWFTDIKTAMAFKLTFG